MTLSWSAARNTNSAEVLHDGPARYAARSTAITARATQKMHFNQTMLALFLDSELSIASCNDSTSIDPIFMKREAID
ncbi:hypothetical protein BofuT4_uP158790.1 [Botrytis cinerea T4]|uniref:Uncharacterized protein n=1 Tax=Botryotinia fuckeliana (strain T4) TaxID=999810 RepID=G2YV35_BOTF4|nr:hypothetical protein BofuT4_uP158790.1 [Botrytis cinerea T4]